MTTKDCLSPKKEARILEMLIAVPHGQWTEHGEPFDTYTLEIDTTAQHGYSALVGGVGFSVKRKGERYRQFAVFEWIDASRDTYTLLADGIHLPEDHAHTLYWSIKERIDREQYDKRQKIDDEARRRKDEADRERRQATISNLENMLKKGV